MESQLKENKTKNKASIIEMMMVVCGITGLFSAMMWYFSGIKDGESNNWIWFSRFTFGILCLGFAGIMKSIRKQ